MEPNIVIVKFIVLGITAPLWWPFLRTIWGEYQATVNDQYVNGELEDPVIHVPLVGVLDAPPRTSAVEPHRVGNHKNRAGFGR
jgi:hypothetical protein